ncbi:MAG: insulinase family protein [Alphaproteobacteria bacterium]|nr:insulinase family protein [Alphaproteobacteria bacterium]
MQSRFQNWLSPAGLGAVLLGLAVLLLSAAPGHAVTVERVVSPGGVEAWLVRDHSVPITAIEFSFRGGAASDPAGKTGLASMTTSLLDEGAGELDSQAFQGRLEDLSVRMSFNAGLETVRGSFKTLNRNRDEAVTLLRLALNEPRFDPEAIERMRRQITAGLKRKSTDPNVLASRVWRRAVFGEHPYARPVDGTLGSIKDISVQDLRGFVAKRFARDRLIVGVVGDITPDVLGPMLDDIFGGLPATTSASGPSDVATGAGGETFVVQMDIPQSVVVFGHEGVRRKSPDYYPAYVMNYILGGGGFSSRLYHEVREKRGLAYSVYSYLNPMKHGALITGGVATRNDQVAQSLAVIREEWGRMREAGPSADELTHAKTFLNGSFPLRLSSTGSIARMLVAMQYNDLGLDYMDRRQDFINAVTLADVQRVARRMLDPDQLTVVVVGSPESVKPTAKAPDIES